MAQEVTDCQFAQHFSCRDGSEGFRVVYRVQLRPQVLVSSSLTSVLSLRCRTRPADLRCFMLKGPPGVQWSADFLRACPTPPRVKRSSSVSSSPASQSSSRAGHRARGPGGPALPGAPGILWGTSADSGRGAAHKRALYLNLTVFVSPLHMNIYREEGPASTPAAPFTESINNSFVKPDLGTED